MIFSYKWLQSFFSKKLPKPEKLAEILTLHSFEAGELKRLGNDWVLNIDILPNRAHDCLSYLGIARECAALLTYNLHLTTYNLRENKKIKGCIGKYPLPDTMKASDLVETEVQDKDACSRYTARVITNVKVGPSPKWLQERLVVCGLRPINNVVDIANYVMLETGQPLHAFDYEKISNLKSQIPKPQLKIQNLKKIIVRRAKKGEKITTLDNEKYDLDESILVIADSKEPLAIAGIKGGKKAEIDKNTKTVILESANFEQRAIRRASKKLNLRTDASLRFEHGIDPNLTEFAINRACCLIKEITAGKAVKGLVDVYPKKVLPKKIKLDLDYVEKLLGTRIPEREIKSILRRLGLKIVNCKLKILNVVVPTFRLDISLPEDLVEEIGRVYGYGDIPSKMPILPFEPPKENRDILWVRKIEEILKGFGFDEAFLYSFISENDAELYLLSPKKFISTLIEVENPTSIDAKYLRPSLLSNLLKAIQRNQESFREIKVFEIGKTYRKKLKVKSEKLKVEESNVKNKFQKQRDILEKKVLAGVLAGQDKFYEIKGYIESLFESLGIAEIFFDSFEQAPEEAPFIFWERGVSAEIREKTGNIKIGFLGKIRDEVLEFYKIKKPVFAFEIDFEKLLEMVEGEHEYEPPSPYPETFRDLSVLIPLNALAGEVIQAINFFGGEVLRDVEVIDIYEGDPLPQGKKNLTFTLIFQSKEKTLSSEEIDKIMEKIAKGIEENIDWEVRR